MTDDGELEMIHMEKDEGDHLQWRLFKSWLYILSAFYTFLLSVFVYANGQRQSYSYAALQWSAISDSLLQAMSDQECWQWMCAAKTKKLKTTCEFFAGR
jgi:hypothetical protein